MAIEVFNRYENKYLIDGFTYQKIQDRLSAYMEKDVYNKDGEFYTISNVYYDTADSTLIRDSLAKPKYKEKMRLRAYGVPDLEGRVFLEIKKKVNGLVNKRRTAFVLTDAYNYIETRAKPMKESITNKQVLSEIDYFLNRYHLVPSVYIAYDRSAFFGIDDPDLRISFDTNIRTRREDLRLEDGDYGEKLLAEDIWLMEIKTKKCIPMWLSDLLCKYKIYSTSFSKYGTEYKNFVASKLRKERIPCLIQSSQAVLQPRYHLAMQY